MLPVSTKTGEPCLKPERGFGQGSLPAPITSARPSREAGRLALSAGFGFEVLAQLVQQREQVRGVEVGELAGEQARSAGQQVQGRAGASRPAAEKAGQAAKPTQVAETARATQCSQATCAGG